MGVAHSVGRVLVVSGTVGVAACGGSVTAAAVRDEPANVDGPAADAAGGDRGDGMTTQVIADAAAPPVTVDATDPSIVAARSLCASAPARPLTAGSYTQPDTGLTVHWPDGWTFTNTRSNGGTLTAPITIPFDDASTGGQARFEVWIAGYGSADVFAKTIPDAVMSAAMAGAFAQAVTLAGQPAVVSWSRLPPAVSGCSAPCGSLSPGPDEIQVAGLVQFAMVDGGVWVNGAEINLIGDAPVGSLPPSIFCDMDAMIRGVTLGP